MKKAIRLFAVLFVLLFLFGGCNDSGVGSGAPTPASPSATPSATPSQGGEEQKLPAHIRYYEGAYYFYPPFTNRELDVHDDEFAANAVLSVKSMEMLREKLLGPDLAKEQLYFFEVNEYLPGVGYKMPYATLLNDDFYTLPAGASVKDISWLQGGECTVRIDVTLGDAGLGDGMTLEWASYPEIVETKEHFLDPATKQIYGEDPKSSSVTINGNEGIKISANNLYPANSSYYVAEKEGVTYFVTITEDQDDNVLAVQVDRYAASGRYRYTVLKPLPQTVARCVEIDPFTPGEPIVQNAVELTLPGAYPDSEQIPALTAPEGVILTGFEKGQLGFHEWIINAYAKDFAHAEEYGAFWQECGYSLLDETYLDDFYHRHEYADRLDAQNVYFGSGTHGDNCIVAGYQFMEPNTQTGTVEKVGYSVNYSVVKEGTKTYYLKNQVRDKDGQSVLFEVRYTENGQVFGYTAKMPDSYYVEHFTEFNPFK